MEVAEIVGSPFPGLDSYMDSRQPGALDFRFTGCRFRDRGRLEGSTIIRAGLLYGCLTLAKYKKFWIFGFRVCKLVG